MLMGRAVKALMILVMGWGAATQMLQLAVMTMMWGVDELKLSLLGSSM